MTKIRAEVIQAMRAYQTAVVKRRNEMAGVLRLLNETKAPSEACVFVKAEHEDAGKLAWDAGVAISMLEAYDLDRGGFLPSSEDWDGVDDY